MGNLAFVHQNGILYLATVSNDALVSYYNISSEICSFAKMALRPNDAGADDHAPMFYDGPLSNVDIISICVVYHPLFPK